MARYGDKGAYQSGNVKICLNEENRAERNQNYPLPGKSNPAYGKDYWASGTEDARKMRSQSISQKVRGIRKRAAMSLALAATATGRRRVVRDGRTTWAYPDDADFPTRGTF